MRYQNGTQSTAETQLERQFSGRDAAEIRSISAGLHPGAKRKISGYGGRVPI
jgi:hypothetical protein